MTDVSPEWKPVCPCGEPTTTATLAENDQWHPPFPPHGKPGFEVPIFIDHPDGTRHRVQHGRVTG